MKKIINTYEDFLNLDPCEMLLLSADLYTDEEQSKIAEFSFKYWNELLSFPGIETEKPKKFNTLKEKLEYYKGYKK